MKYTLLAVFIFSACFIFAKPNPCEVVCGFEKTDPHIHLTPQSGQGGFDLMVGKRISAIIAKDRRTGYAESMVVGRLNAVSRDSIVVDKMAIAIKDLSHIGRRKSGSGAVSWIFTFSGVGLFVNGISGKDTTPCPTCQTVSSDSGGGKAASVVAGAAFMIIGISTGVRNSPKDLKTWKLEVIE